VDNERGPKVLLIGDVGTGKTYAPAFLALDGYDVFYIFTEPGMDTFKAFPSELSDLIGTKIFYTYKAAISSDIDVLLNATKKVNMLNYEALSNLPEADKKNTTEYIDIINALRNFVDDNTKKSFGNVSTWGMDRVLVIDSLSGLNYAIMRNAVGTKPVPGLQWFNVAQKSEEDLLNFLCFNLKCWVIITAHPEREVDENTGTTKIYPSAIGRKLAPRIGRFFSEVLETVRKNDKYYWSNENPSMVQKRRLFPAGSKLETNWEPLIRHFPRKTA
jgi:hypothetical protein